MLLRRELPSVGDFPISKVSVPTKRSKGTTNVALWPFATEIHCPWNVGDPGKRGLVVLNVSFVARDPQRTSSFGQTSLAQTLHQSVTIVWHVLKAGDLQIAPNGKIGICCE